MLLGIEMGARSRGKATTHCEAPGNGSGFRSAPCEPRPAYVALVVLLLAVDCGAGVLGALAVVWVTGAGGVLLPTGVVT